jgi:hypothetical protein
MWTDSSASERFIAGLEQGDLDQIRAVPKSDLHNHCWMGGRIAYIEERMGIEIERPPTVCDADLVFGWVSSTFILPIYEAEGREIAIEAAFVQAADDGVTTLATSLGVFMLSRIYGGDIRREIGAFKRLHSHFAPHVTLHPVLGFNRGLCHPDEVIGMLEDHLELEFFEAIDLYGDEFARPIQDFKALYRRAKAYGLGLTAHVGEFGDAESIQEAVSELELQQVQHGIAAADSPRVMRFLADNGIQLNVCPTSNIRLGRVTSYKHHPIRTLYDNGVRVTVNTDDVALFDQGVSEEFSNLYREGCFTAQELDDVRRNGLATTI